METNDEPWQKFMCDECHKDSTEFIKLDKYRWGDEHSKFYLCLDCLKKATELAIRAARERRKEVKKQQDKILRDAQRGTYLISKPGEH